MMWRIVLFVIMNLKMGGNLGGENTAPNVVNKLNGRAKMREIVCPICGKKFVPNKASRVYCSYACRNEKKLEDRRKLHDKEAERKRQEKAKTNGQVIDAYALEAKERHISYGKLQIERTLRKMKEGTL